MLKLKQSFIISAITLTLAGSAVAIGSPNAKAEDARRAAQDRKTTVAEVTQDRRALAEARLTDAKLKACQRRETAINNLMARIADRGTKQLDVFDKIAERTEAFYVNKGKVLGSYETLVADVNAKKLAAQTAVDEVKATSVSFACDGNDPKGTAASFKAALKSETSALKAYKTAIKNLIVGVKSVQGTTAKTSTDESSVKSEGAQQ